MDVPLVYVVDDDEDFRDSLCSLLVERGLGATGFQSAEEFLAACDGTPASCALLDVRMSGMSGLSLQQEMTDRGIGIPTIIMTAYGDVATAVTAMKAGAVDFVQKPFEVEDLLTSLKEALRVGERDRSRMEVRERACSRLKDLTDREQQVLREVVAGTSNKEIADRLGISPRTVETHRKNVMRKTGTDSLPALVRLVVRAES